MDKKKDTNVRAGYVTPVTEVFNLRMNAVLCGSNEKVGRNTGSW